MKSEILKKFAILSSCLSPENLACDGECSRAEIRQRYKAIMKEWKALEKIVGRKVNEAETYHIFI